MNDLSIAQKYLLCTLTEKGRPCSTPEQQLGLVLGGLMDLNLEGCAVIEKKTVRISGPLPEKLTHLQTLYDFLNGTRPMAMEKIAEEYAYSVTERRLRGLIRDTAATLETEGLVVKQAGGLLGKQERWVPEHRAVDLVVDQLRAELLEEGQLSEETAILTVLLECGKVVKRYFSPYEQTEIRKTLKALKQTPSSRMARELTEHVENLYSLIVITTLLN